MEYFSMNLGGPYKEILIPLKCVPWDAHIFKPSHPNENYLVSIVNESWMEYYMKRVEKSLQVYYS